MKAQLVQNMPVVSMADGTKIGSVNELLFETTTLRLAALLLTGSSGTIMLPVEKVRSFGNDVVTVEDATVTQGVEGNAALNSLRGLKDLSHLRVIDGDGSWIGDVKDFDFEPGTGKVAEITVHRGGVLGLGGTTTTIPTAAIRGIGPKVITVERPAGGTASEKSPAER